MRDRSRQYLSPVAVMGRALTCTRCGKLIDLVEIPHEDVDANTYVCLDHFRPITNTARRENEAAAPRTPIAEPPAPPRPLATQIRDYCSTAFGDAA